MLSDEEQIRQLAATWANATRAGDTETVLGLMTDDVVFLVPGRAPMRKADFAAASTPPSGATRPTIDATSDIQEIRIVGDWAFMWTKLSVTVTPADGGAPIRRAGHTLTILQKIGDHWLLARDANLLAPVSKAPG